jgi:CMP-N-acetylneuraminic acid synthetase
MISVFLPTRKGSERVINKNTRDFAGLEGGLLKLKLTQLLSSHLISEIILSTDDPSSIKVAESYQSKKIKVIERPEALALSSTSLIDLVRYVPTICNAEHILWTHVTSLFVLADDYDAICEKYFKQIKVGNDSLMTVKPIRNFIWDKDQNDLINRINNEKWPRTQDLKVYYEIDSAVFLSSRSNYLKFGDRVGKYPYLYEMDGIKSFDVDWEEDFKLAEILYNGLYASN